MFLDRTRKLLLLFIIIFGAPPKKFSMYSGHKPERKVMYIGSVKWYLLQGKLFKLDNIPSQIPPTESHPGRGGARGGNGGGGLVPPLFRENFQIVFRIV